MASDSQEVEYEKDEGFVRINLRRPVNLYVPSDQLDTFDPFADSEQPNTGLKLDWVYGYRGRDCRNNMFVLGSGELVYFTAAVAVIYNPETHSQRHFIHHTDDIKCLNVHPDGKTVATGQIKGKDDNLPHVCVWDSDTLKVLQKFGGSTFNRGVACIAFSNEGDLLAAVDDASEPVLSVWNWEEGTMEFESKASSSIVIGVTFSHEIPSRIVTMGKNHLGFWTKESDGDYGKKMAIYEDFDKPKYVTSVLPLPAGNVLTGDTNGNIFVWNINGNTVMRALSKLHEGSVFSMSLNEDGTIIAGTSDMKIVVYDEDLNPSGDLLQIPNSIGAGRVVRKIGEDIYVGTTLNGLIKVTMGGKFTSITEGHVDELWGLAINPIEPRFAVAGQDGKLVYRNSNENKVIWQKNIEMVCQSVEINPDGSRIIVGGDKGLWKIIDSSTGDILHEESDGDEFIQVIRFSPAGDRLALGSRDNTVYIYDKVERKFTKKGELEGHSSFITHLDWSENGNLLRTNSGDYEVLYWDVDNLSLLTSKEDYRDVKWATNNCIISFESFGIWPPGVDGTHINCCNKAYKDDLLATGDDFGILKLFNYPSSVQNAKYRYYLGHSSHITNLEFLCDDSNLITVGGRDFTTMKWRLINE